MGIYVDAADIQQHVRGAAGVTPESIEELMAEQEYYVQTVLNLNELPPENPILSNIIRDLTTAAVIYDLLSPNESDTVKADNIRREAIRRLEQVDNKIGLGINNATAGIRDTNNQVINPFEGAFFKPEDFGL